MSTEVSETEIHFLCVYLSFFLSLRPFPIIQLCVTEREIRCSVALVCRLGTGIWLTLVRFTFVATATVARYGSVCPHRPAREASNRRVIVSGVGFDIIV